MAKIYAVPEAVGNPPGYDWRDPDGWQQREDQWVETLRAWVRENGKGEYAGEIVRDQVADGYASYMVLRLRPLELIHLPLGDGYQSRWAHRWTASDVKQMVEPERSLTVRSRSREGSS